MLNNMEDQIKIFIAGLKIWAKRNKVNQATLGDIISRHQSSVSAYYKNESRPTPDMIEAWVNHFSLDYEEILNLGRTELQPPQDIDQKIKAEVDAKFKAYTDKLNVQPNDLDNHKRKKNQPHHDIVDRFKNAQKAYEINCDLLKLEELNPPALDEIHDLIRFKLSKAAGLPSSVSGESLKPNGTGE